MFYYFLPLIQFQTYAVVCCEPNLLPGEFKLCINFIYNIALAKRAF